MDITHDNVCSSMLSCFYSHLLSTGRPISSCLLNFITLLTNSVISYDKCGILGYKVLRNFVIFGDTCETLGY